MERRVARASGRALIGGNKAFGVRNLLSSIGIG